MKNLFENLFSFHGRLSRLGYLKYQVILSIFLLVLIIASIPLFRDDQDSLRYAGIAYLVVVGLIFFISVVSIIVRRLHHIGISGWHVIWIIALYPAGQLALAYAGKTFELLGLGFQYLLQTQVNPNMLAELLVITLPHFLVDLWLLLMPGKEEPHSN